MLGAWLVVMGLMGLGRRHLDRPSRTLAYLSQAFYPIYILHQTVIVVSAFFLIRSAAAWPAQWLAILVVAVAATFGLYDLVRRTPVTRFLFGMRAKR